MGEGFRQTLRLLGFATYQDYLNSDLWKAIRRRAMQRDKKRCQVCGGAAQTVHHRDYTLPVMRGQNIKSLVSLCRAHHREIEFTDGVKCDLGKANKRLNELLELRELTVAKEAGDRRNFKLLRRVLWRDYGVRTEQAKGGAAFVFRWEDDGAVEFDPETRQWHRPATGECGDAITDHELIQRIAAATTDYEFRSPSAPLCEPTVAVVKPAKKAKRKKKRRRR